MEILSLGMKVRKKRKEKNLTLKELAGEKVTQGQISLIESGKSNPSMDLLKYLADKLNVTVDYLLESEDMQVRKIFTYYSNMFFLFMSTNNLREAENYLKKAEKVYDEYKIYDHLIYIHYLKGTYYDVLGKWDIALSYFYKATFHQDLFTFEEILDFSFKASDIAYRQKAYNVALTYLKSLEKLTEVNPLNIKHLKRIYYKLINVNRQLKNYDEMDRYIELTVSSINSTGKSVKSVEHLISEAAENEELDIRKAYEYAELGRKINDRHEITIEHMDIMRNMSSFLIKDERWKEAMDITMREIAYSNVYNDGKNSMVIILRIARILASMNEKNLTNAILEFVRDRKNIESPEVSINYHLALAEVSKLDSDYNKTIEELSTILSIAKNINNKAKAAEAALSLSEIYLNNNNCEEAKKYLETYMKLKDYIS